MPLAPPAAGRPDCAGDGDHDSRSRLGRPHAVEPGELERSASAILALRQSGAALLLSLEGPAGAPAGRHRNLGDALPGDTGALHPARTDAARDGASDPGGARPAGLVSTFLLPG